jgi:hypothetical protein
MRVDHEYERKGAVAYLAAYDVHQARVFCRCEQTTGIEPFGRLVEQVMSAEPYASAKRVFWVVDNGSSHRGQASVERLEGAWPTLRLVHLPVHASWLDQAEIYVSIVQRKVVDPNDFFDGDGHSRDTAPEPFGCLTTARRACQVDRGTSFGQARPARPADPPGARPRRARTHDQGPARAGSL